MDSCFLDRVSLLLLLTSTTVADVYNNIRLPLFQIFELSFSSIMFLKFMCMLLNRSCIGFSIWSSNALFSLGLIAGLSTSARLSEEFHQVQLQAH